MNAAMPERIARLPRDDAGRPIPWFTALIDNKPDLRVHDAAKFNRAVKEDRCWVCGQRFSNAGGRSRSFIVGPISVFTRIAAEPPSHRTCALYSLAACPFLATPGRRRRAARLPEEVGLPGGSLTENPGVVFVWMCRRFNVEWADDAPLCKMSYPSGGIYAYREGLPVLRTDLNAAVDAAEATVRTAAAESGGDPADVERMVRAGRVIIETRIR